VSHRANEVKKDVGEIQSEVEILRNAFREVRQLAEGTETKAASTEAQLGRVGRLEAEVSALRAVPVVSALAPLIAPPAVFPIALDPATTCPACRVPPVTSSTHFRRNRNNPLTGPLRTSYRVRRTHRRHRSSFRFCGAAADKCHANHRLTRIR
jgi:hypothetical protein